MNKEKIRRAHLAIGVFLIQTITLAAQPAESLSLDSCYAMAMRNYPSIKQYELIHQSEEYTLENVSKGYFPQVSINGQATYQSDVTQIELSNTVPLPFSFPTMSKDQYKIYGEVVQPVTDLFTINEQKEMVKASGNVETAKADVDLYKLRERINQLFFGILLIDEQVKQVELTIGDLQAGIDKTNAAIANGVALKRDLDLLQAELLKARQRITELKASRKTYSEMLALFINRPVGENVRMEMPLVLVLSSDIKRPELTLFQNQKNIFDIQRRLVIARTLPRFSLFLQSGYGRPGLNMLSNEFDFYFIGGLRLNWNLSTFYTYRNDRQLLSVQQRALDIQSEVFVFNTRLALAQQNTEIEKLRELIAMDNEIIALRTDVKSSAQGQLANGTMTANEYVSYVNAEEKAKQDRAIHNVQLLMAQYNHKTASGN